jgi:hypothetical protein
MATIEKLEIALSTEMTGRLRKAWLEAVADDSNGIDQDAVFDRPEEKYKDMAEESGR